jgi:hypothetical protein
MDRRSFLLSSSALLITSSFSVDDAEAWVWWLARTLGRSAIGRHMGRFGAAGSRLRYSGVYRGATAASGSTSLAEERAKAWISLAHSRAAHLTKQVGEIVFDNSGIGFAPPLNGQVGIVCGANATDVHCSAFPSLSTKNADQPVVMELAELIMLDAIGKKLPELYPSKFSSTESGESAKTIMSCIHPVARIKDGEFDNEWNHITPLIYATARGRVTFELTEKIGVCTINRQDTAERYDLEIPFNHVDIVTGARV